MFLFAFLSPVNGSHSVKLLSFGGFLEVRHYSAIMFPRIRSHGGLLEEGVYSREGLFGGGGFLENLRYSKKTGIQFNTYKSRCLTRKTLNEICIILWVLRLVEFGWEYKRGLTIFSNWEGKRRVLHNDPQCLSD